MRRPLLLILCALAGCSPAAKEGRPPAGPAKVKVAKPLVETIVEWDAYTGRLAAVDSVEVRSRVSGHLQSHHFKEGSIVKAGDLLFLVDPKPFAVAVERARAALRQAEADQAVAHSQLSQAEADAGRVEAQLNLAKVRERRALNLRESGTLTQDLLDERISERKQVAAQLTASRAAIGSARSLVVRREADVAAAKVELEGALLDLSYTRVRAPIAGRVDRRLVTQGNYVTGGLSNGTLLTTIVSLDPIHCYFDADEQAHVRYVRLAKSGARQSSRDVKNPVYVGLVDEQGFPHQGHMDFVGNRLEDATATIRGRAILPNPDLLLAPGLFARVRLPGSAPHQAILIPDAAVGADQSERFVLVVAGGKTERRVVELGPLHGGLRIVRAGLEPEEQIVIEGLQRVRPGAEVEASEETLAAHKGPADLPDRYEPVPRAEWLSVEPDPPPAEVAPVTSPQGGR